MKPLTVCHVIHNTEFGGTETMLLQVLRQLQGQLRLSVISLKECGEIGKRIEQLGVPVYPIRCHAAGRFRPHRLWQLAKQIRSMDPDVVQTWGYHADLIGGLAARAATQSAVVWNIRHSTLEPSMESVNVLRSARLGARLSRWIPDQILLNAWSAVESHTAVGYDATKMRVLPNGFDVSRFCPSQAARQATRRKLRLDDNVPLIGMCGRFHTHKGQSDFVRMAQHVGNVRPEAHFVIAGHGCDSSNDELMKWIEAAGLSDRFHLLGPRQDVPDVLNSMDVFVLPSLTEAMPNVVGEAMACGVPTVATDVGDAGRLLGACGTVVPPGDVNAMAAAVGESLAKSATERAALGAQARNRIVEHYKIDTIAADYLAVWRETADRGAATRATATVSPFLRRAAGQGGRGDRQRAAADDGRPKLVHVTTLPMTQYMFLRGQNAFMTSLGFDVHAVSTPGPYLQRLEDRDPVTCHPIPISRKIDPIRDAIAAIRLYRLFRKLRPEMVQVSTSKAALLGAAAAKAARVPVRIYQVRGLSSESESGLNRWLFRQFEKLTARLCNAHLVNSQSLLTYAQQSGILHSGFVAGHGTSNGVALDRLDPAGPRAALAEGIAAARPCEPGPVIGYVGRLSADKGIEELGEVWKLLRDEFPTATLLLVGPWERENAVSPRCREALEHDQRVIITGVQDDVAAFYRAMDVFVFASHGTEGFPNAPMEAAAMGLPVVATRVVGCVDAVVDGVTGRLIPPQSPSDLRAAICEYLRDPELRAAHGWAGRERVSRGFRPQDLWQDFRDFYFHLLRREGISVPAEAAHDATYPNAA